MSSKTDEVEPGMLEPEAVSSKTDEVEPGMLLEPEVSGKTDEVERDIVDEVAQGKLLE